MKGMEVPSVKPLGQAPMGMEGASCGEHERDHVEIRFVDRTATFIQAVQ